MKTELKWKDQEIDPQRQHPAEMGYAGKNLVAQLVHTGETSEVRVWAKRRGKRREIAAAPLESTAYILRFNPQHR